MAAPCRVGLRSSEMVVREAAIEGEANPANAERPSTTIRLAGLDMSFSDSLHQAEGVFAGACKDWMTWRELSVSASQRVNFAQSDRSPSLGPRQTAEALGHIAMVESHLTGVPA